MADFSIFKDFPVFAERMYTSETNFHRRESMPFPPINLGEDDEAIHARALTPGVTRDNLRLVLQDRALIIEGELSPLAGHYFRQERFSGPFRRMVALTVPVRRDAVSARLHDGVLEITLPKASTGRFISIHPRS